jgi:hypothetical protein
MNEDRKKPLTWPWVAVGLPILYIASFGPASWLASWGALPLTPTAMFYKPIFLAGKHGPSLLDDGFRWYSEIGEFKLGMIFGELRWRSGVNDWPSEGDTRGTGR